MKVAKEGSVLQSMLLKKGVGQAKSSTSNNIQYFRYWLKPRIFNQRWNKRGKRKLWLKRVKVLRRWRFNRRSAKVWKFALFLNTSQITRRRLRVLKDFNTRKILLDFLSWKLQTKKDRIRFLVNRNFKHRNFAQNHVSNLLWNILGRWDLVLFYTGLVKNRDVCLKLIKNKSLLINGVVVTGMHELQNTVEVGYSVSIVYSRNMYFRQFWRKRNSHVWPALF